MAYHCFRGLLAPDTAVLLDTAQPPAHSAADSREPTGAAAASWPFPDVAQLTLDDADPAGAAAQHDESGGSDSNGSGSGAALSRLVLLNRQPRVSREPSANIVNVFTNDGEVSKVLLSYLRGYRVSMLRSLHQLQLKTAGCSWQTACRNQLCAAVSRCFL